MTLQSDSSMAPSSQVNFHRSPWHSPVPYLFGGLAAMLSLIAFALLILACSYSKNASNSEDDGEGERERDLESGDSKLENQDKEFTAVFEEKYLVIMAGQTNPTFLATPVSSRTSSFGSCSCQSNTTRKSLASDVEMMEDNEKEKKDSDDQLQMRNMVNQETTDQLP